MGMIKVIGFDADDTLWVNGSFFKETESYFCSLMSDYIDAESLLHELYNTEMKNLDWYGYGAMAFTLSLIETAVKVSNNKVSADIINKILEAGRDILAKPVSLHSGVSEVLPGLSSDYKLIVITKGDLLDQERKLSNSGLLPFFDHIEILSEKHEANYIRLLKTLNIRPEEFLMVGNSFKSDISPVLEIGGMAVYIPCNDVWQHENSEKPNGHFFEISSMSELPDLMKKINHI
jgi:putative hydrolase of the HAD superfamily